MVEDVPADFLRLPVLCPLSCVIALFNNTGDAGFHALLSYSMDDRLLGAPRF